jgi:DNA-binding CsgD family transcriptional regulator
VTPETVFGRASELARLERFLDDVRLGPSALLIEGEAGVGKTTIWRATVAATRRRGYRVLSCHPAESEASLSFAGLGDLLYEALKEPHPSLPAPQSRALKVAVLMEDPGSSPPDQRSISVATLGLLRAIAAETPTVLAIDDCQWLDPASRRVLEFVLRRLEAERIGLAAAFRNDNPDIALALLGRDFSQREPARIVLGPLPLEALDALFHARLGESFPRPVLRQIAATSAGNPLFALEIARGVLRGEIRVERGETLPVPRTLQQFVQARLGDLPADVKDMLVLAAATTEPTVELLSRAAAHPDPAGTLDAAVAAGVVQVADGHVRFSHPLFASTLYHGVAPSERRLLHRHLAGVTPGLHERARHLSLAAEGPDEALATALEDAASAAAKRGAQDAAGDLCEQASRLTPATESTAANRRRVQAAEYHFASGNSSVARRLLEELATALPAGPDRADVLRRLAKVRYRSDSCSVAADLLTRALDEAGPDARLRAVLERDLSWAAVLCGDVPDAARHARSGLQLVDDDAADLMFSELLAASSMTDFLLGSGLPREAMQRSLDLERPRPEVPIEWRAGMMFGLMLKWSGEIDSARSAFEQLHHDTIEAGDETSLPFLLAQLSEAATMAGDFTTAIEEAAEAHALALQTGQEPIRATALYARALAEAHLGRTDDARRSARAGLTLSEAVGSVFWMMLNQAVLGFVELSVDDPAAAHGWLGPLVAWLEVVGIREPGVLWFVPDEIEALIALGQLDKAASLLASWQADAERTQRRSALLAAARCRALVDAARGDSSGAARALELALRDHGRAVPRFDRARTNLALGTIQRRTRRRRASRESLDAALSEFEATGAVLWADKARDMLGPNERRHSDALTARLTPAEQRVAELVATGATNREVADRLFVSVRGVEVHLTSVYRKLGISSRTQLAARLVAAEAERSNGALGGSSDTRPT